MREETVRTSLDIPRGLHRRLREAAAQQGCSARQLVLNGIRKAVEVKSSPVRRTRLKLDPPIVHSRGKVFDLTSEQIHEIVELP